MIVEITSAVNFLVQFMRIQIQNKKLKINESQLDLFKGSMSNLLQTRYHNHWYPKTPNKGSAYRCIRSNSRMIDPIIAQAGAAIGLPLTTLRSMLPDTDLTLWIDPEEVSYRFGEDFGSVCSLYVGEPKTQCQVDKHPAPRVVRTRLGPIYFFCKRLY